MPEALLATKLYLPELPSRLVRRSSLVELLKRELSAEKRLILVCAPAGYGKTTLVCEWLQNVGSTCWISLEKSDSDPRIFFAYLIASLQKTFPGLGEQARLLLDVPQLPPLQAILSSLLNDLAGINTTCVLVFDDYHAISSKAIHEGIAFLLDHLPPNKHIVITTRSDPALPLHRYRSRGQLIEIRADDLRFSAAEVSSYMQEIVGISLTDSEIAVVEGRTEGWVASLQMVALSLRGKAGKEEMIRSLQVTHRYILDYLLEEVLNNQSETVQRFLMETAILDRLYGPLCNALTGIGEEASRQVLQELERANLFIIPLDVQRDWYRYHHLFQDLLVISLKQSPPEKVKVLHQKAAKWYDVNGWMSEAVHHYIEGADFERAADLVEHHTIQLFGQGKLDQLVGWIHKLPSALSADRPSLSIYQAWALAFAGKTTEAEQVIQVALQALNKNRLSPKARKNLWAEIHTIRAVLLVMSGRDQEALASLCEIGDPPDSLFACSAMLWAQGYAWRMQGQLDKAAQAFQEMLRCGRQINNLWTLATGFADLGMVLRMSGKLQQAEAAFREGLLTMKQAGAGGLGFVGRLESFLASVLYEQDRLDEAELLIAASINHNQLWNNPNHLTHAYLTEARIRFARGDKAGEDALRRAEEIAAHATLVPSLRAAADALRVGFWLRQGQIADARNWMDRLRLSQETPRHVEVLDAQLIARARIAIAEKNWSAARQCLERLEQDARSGGRINTLIETLALKALAASNRAIAVQTLEAGLQLGVPEGYRRIFLDEGERLLPLLESLRDRSDLVEPLIGGKAKMSKPSKLLTARELDILHGIADGLSNKEIGHRLYLSAGTVKAHSAAIYRKLDVSNRTEAIARAKDLGIV